MNYVGEKNEDAFMDVALYNGVHLAFRYEGMAVLSMDHKGVFGSSFRYEHVVVVVPEETCGPCLLISGC